MPNPQKFKTVMLIDDSEIDLYIVAKLITINKFCTTVLKFTSGIDALEYLKGNWENKDRFPDIIFLDINMPLMTGFEFADAYGLIPLESKKDCRIYIVSSTMDSSDIERANNHMDVHAFHQKPVTKAFLDSISL